MFNRPKISNNICLYFITVFLNSLITLFRLVSKKIDYCNALPIAGLGNLRPAGHIKVLKIAILTIKTR